MNGKNTRKNEYFYIDLAAVLLGVGLFAFFFATARLGIPTVDEADYCNLRYIQGDIPFVEWWDPAQLFWFITSPIVKIYMLINGSTDGILLFMRYVFLSADALFYFFMYKKLRAYKTAGLVSSLLFCAVAPQTILSVSYFTCAAFSFLAACLILIIDGREKSRITLFFTGVMLAVGIMAEPFLIILYIIYIIFVIARELLKAKRTPIEKYSFLLNGRSCLWLTLGAFVVFAMLVAYLAYKGTFSRVFEMLQYIFGGVKYNSSSSFLNTAKLRQAITFYRVPVAAGFAVLVVLCAVSSFVKRSHKSVRLALFACSCVMSGFCWLRIFYGVFISSDRDLVLFINYHGILYLVCAVIWYLLCDKKDARVSVMLFASVLYSAAVDAASSSVLGTGGALALFPGIHSFLLLAREALSKLKEKSSEEKKTNIKAASGRIVGGSCVLLSAMCAAGFIFWQGSFVSLETIDSPIENHIAFSSGANEPYSVKLTSGPFKGIITSEHIAEVYNNALTDLDEIKERTDGEPVLVYGFTPFAYLYMDLPYGSHGAWYDGDIERHLKYWELFPERKPAYIYFPLFDNLYWATPGDMGMRVNVNEHITGIQTEFAVLGELNAVYGKAGVILERIKKD